MYFLPQVSRFETPYSAGSVSKSQPQSLDMILCSFVVLEYGNWTKSKKPVIPSAIDYRQNPLESTGINMLTISPAIRDVARGTTALPMISPQVNTIIHVQTLHNPVHYAAAAATVFPSDQHGGPQRTEVNSRTSQDTQGSQQLLALTTGAVPPCRQV
jgi:hypothetical protein